MAASLPGQIEMTPDMHELADAVGHALAAPTGRKLWS